MREMEFDFVIYPLKLIITVGLDYKTLCDRFENMEPEHEGKWGDEDDMDKEASFANLVRDRDDDDKFAILWNFSSDDDLIMRNICHESFHIAMSVCQFCNMSLGFKVGEDEHAAYIAGFAGDCVSEFIKVIIYQFTPVHFDASQPRLLPATPRPLPGSPPVTYFIGLEDSVFLTQISLYF